MNLLNSGVMQGLVGATTYMKATDVAMKVFYEARNRGDTAVMGQAQGYAKATMNTAAECSKKAQKALREAQKEAKEQIKAEQEAAQKEKAQQEATNKSKLVDAVEISEEGQAMIDDKAHTGKMDTHTQVKEIVTNKVAVTEGIYTAQGSINPVSVDEKLSVMA